MAKIFAPNKQYSGMSASVAFVKGVGETENPTLLSWFRDHGYEVEAILDEDQQQDPDGPPEDPPKDPGKFDGMDVDQLKVYAEEHEINIGQSSSVNGILKKILDAEKEAEQEA